MISEVNFARNYSAFWFEYAPWLKNYVNSVNTGFADRLYPPLNSKDEPKYRSINNVVSFTLFKNIILENNNSLTQAYADSLIILNNYPRTNLTTYQLTTPNVDIITSMSEKLIERYKKTPITFYPQFNGCGILDNCQGDLLQNNTLIEIKAGERNITASDLRQILIYTALNWLANKKNISDVELFNPRMGMVWQTSLVDFVSSISDLSMEDLFEQIGKHLSNLSEDIIF